MLSERAFFCKRKVELIIKIAEPVRAFSAFFAFASSAVTVAPGS